MTAIDMREGAHKLTLTFMIECFDIIVTSGAYFTRIHF